MDIATLQQTLPWGGHEYNEEFQARADAQRDAGHAMLHVTKAAGKIAGLLDEFDHPHASATILGQALRNSAGKYLADLVICALRIANTWPGGAIDLDAAISRRLTEKFLRADGVGT